MSYCSNCGAEVDPGGRYCPECGEAVAHGGQDTGRRQPKQGSAQPQHGDGQAQGSRHQQPTQRTRTGQRSGYDDGEGYPRRPDRDDTDVIGARIGAQIVDSIAMFMILIGITAIFGGFGAAAGGDSGSGIAGLGLLLGFGGMLFYGFLLEGYWDGYTVGKKLFGIKVVQESGEACNYGSAFVRNFLEIIDGLFYYLVGFVAMASSDKRQRVGDRLGGTVVVRDEP
jgi:uncharacterized RDD family membrane protein YckC